jgi:hypothetical protein
LGYFFFPFVGGGSTGPFPQIITNVQSTINDSTRLITTVATASPIINRLVNLYGTVQVSVTRTAGFTQQYVGITVSALISPGAFISVGDSRIYPSGSGSTLLSFPISFLAVTQPLPTLVTCSLRANAINPVPANCTVAIESCELDVIQTA